jgi:hypothetical protein
VIILICFAAKAGAPPSDIIDRPMIEETPIKPIKNSILETAASLGNLNTILNKIDETYYSYSLAYNKGPYTIIAPIDNAFAKLTEKEIRELFDESNITTTIEFMIINGNYTAEELKDKKSIETIQGTSLPVDSSEGLKIGGSRVIRSDILCGNGIIHLIDTAIIPPSEIYIKPISTISSETSSATSNVDNPAVSGIPLRPPVESAEQRDIMYDFRPPEIPSLAVDAME